MLILHDTFDRIKTKFQELEWSRQVRWRNTQKKNLPPKKVFFQFNKITFSSLRLQDLGSNISDDVHVPEAQKFCDPQPGIVFMS